MTMQLSEMERVVFGLSSCMLSVPLQKVVTFDGDLVGTRVTKLQVKLLSPQNAKNAGHLADVLWNRGLFAYWLCNFRHRGNGQESGACAIMERLLEGEGQQSLSSLILTADRGDGRDSFVNYLRRKGISSIFVRPDHFVRVHPFLTACFLRVGRSDEIDSFRNDDDKEDQDDGEEIADVYGDMDDDYFKFKISVGGSEGPASFKAFRKDSTRAPSRLQATAVGIPNSDPFSKVLQFYHDLPARRYKTLGVWIASPRCTDLRNDLFSSSVEELEDEYMKCPETQLLSTCRAVTLEE